MGESRGGRELSVWIQEGYTCLWKRIFRTCFVERPVFNEGNLDIVSLIAYTLDCFIPLEAQRNPLLLQYNTISPHYQMLDRANPTSSTPSTQLMAPHRKAQR